MPESVIPDEFMQALLQLEVEIKECGYERFFATKPTQQGGDFYNKTPRDKDEESDFIASLRTTTSYAI